LILGNNSLSGSIPSELGLLTNLRGIDFGEFCVFIAME